MRGRRRRLSGFTLIELLVVSGIVAILTAASVPLYLNSVRSARRSEAADALGAVVTSQQGYYQRHGAFANALASLNLDMSDVAAQWAMSDPQLIAGPPPGFTCVATGKAGTACAGLSVTLTYVLGGGRSLVDDTGKPL